MSAPRWIRPAAPVGVAVAGLVVVIVAASSLLPERVTIIRSPGGGGAAFASRDDLLLVTAATVLALVVVYLLSAAALAWTPVRHLLVPRGTHWKHASRRRELRRRLAVYLARSTAAALWFVAALVVVALLGQDGGIAGSWWIPLALSIVYVVGMLVWFTWVLTAGFTPPRSTERRVPTERSSSRDEPRGPRGVVATSAPGAGSREVAGGAGRTPAPRPAPRPGEASSPPTKGPPRPYQPRPQQRGLPPRD